MYVQFINQAITIEMQKAVNRFWDWLFHPSIRWYHYPKGKASWFRYPSPGSIVRHHPVRDYKTPFQNTELNIRYAKPIRSVANDRTDIYAADAPDFTLIDKLRTSGLLEPGTNSDEQIQKAKQKFLQKYGFPAEQRGNCRQKKIYRNTFSSVNYPEGKNRQSYRQSVEASFKHFRESQKALNMPSTNRRFIKQPQAVYAESLDMFSHAHFQQTRIQVNYKLDNYANENAKRGYVQIRKGEKSFWKALDDSNNIKNIQKVQRSIGDDKPTDFNFRDTKVELQKDEKGNVIDVHPKTRSV